MLIGDLRPTTISGVKSLAAQLRKEQRIKHSEALDLAAKAANCSNFRNAQRTLPAHRISAARPYVLLTCYWWDKDERHRIGRETIRIELSRPILDTCSKSALKTVRGFGNLRMVADDHFVCDALAPTQSNARERLCATERSLRFMEHTGLRPSRDCRKAYLNGLASDELPNKDHATYWVDQACGQFILIDEPYRGAPDEGKRAAWAARTGWKVAKTTWPGMYNPHRCDLYVATDGRSGYDLAPLVAKIDGMAAPLLESDWSGESAPSWDTFVSPMAYTAQDRRRARCRGTIYPSASVTSVPYNYDFGTSRRRPAGAMGVDGHIEAGRIIKAVLRADQRPYGVEVRISALRSTLEDWMALEIGRGQLEGPEFFAVYYHDTDGDDSYQEMAKSRAGMVDILTELKRKLRTAYPDCRPLRQQLHRIDMSVSLIRKMKSSAD